MACTKLQDFDKTNPNYSLLIEAVDEGRISLDESRCIATIVLISLEAKFVLGMKAYLESQGYAVLPITASFPESP